jgi:hypothetical protein
VRAQHAHYPACYCSVHICPGRKGLETCQLVKHSQWTRVLSCLTGTETRQAQHLPTAPHVFNALLSMTMLHMPTALPTLRAAHHNRRRVTVANCSKASETGALHRLPPSSSQHTCGCTAVEGACLWFMHGTHATRPSSWVTHVTLQSHTTTATHPHSFYSFLKAQHSNATASADPPISCFSLPYAGCAHPRHMHVHEHLTCTGMHTLLLTHDSLT